MVSLLAMTSAKAQETLVLSQDVELSSDSAPDGASAAYEAQKPACYIEIGAGINLPFVENEGFGHRHVTANYGIGIGKWFTPYIGWRVELQGGSIHWNSGNPRMAHAKTINCNIDMMWDILNSFTEVNPTRAFSIYPFVGLGSTVNWDIKNNLEYGTLPRSNEFMFPVSAGVQLSYRMSRKCKIFIQARTSFYGDNYNNVVLHRPVDIDLTALCGVCINIGKQ